MTTLVSLSIALGLLAQQAKDAPDDRKDDASAARLAFMKDSVKPYDLRPLEAKTAPFKLQADPIFRLNNVVSGVKDGAIFLWLDEVDRPQAAVQVFLIPSREWLHEFTSLSNGPFTAEVDSESKWHPEKPGLEFKPVADAPKPAATPELRLRQMRTLASSFTADDDFEGKGWQVLRLLPRPLHRYGKAGSKVEDGALFTYVLASDPEVFLLLEVRPGKDGPEWQYAFAPMTSHAVRGYWKGKVVWELPWRKSENTPAAPFYDMLHSKER